MTHDSTFATVAGALVERRRRLLLNRTSSSRAASGRPVIDWPRFRPTNVTGTTPAQQSEFDRVMDGLTVRLEGLYLTRAAGFPAGAPLIARAALHSLEIMDCTLDPGGGRDLLGARAPIHDALQLASPSGFAVPADEVAFKQTPEVHVQRSVTGPVHVDGGYTLFLADAIVDAGAGVFDTAAVPFAVSAVADPVNGWGPPTQVSGLTCFGRMRVEHLSGHGGIWVHALEVHDNQSGCVKESYFAPAGNRLPPHHACVTGLTAELRFVNEAFGDPAYGQLAATADFRIRERGPGDDAGAFGFPGAHRYSALQIASAVSACGTRPPHRDVGSPVGVSQFASANDDNFSGVLHRQGRVLLDRDATRRRASTAWPGRRGARRDRCQRRRGAARLPPAASRSRRRRWRPAR